MWHYQRRRPGRSDAVQPNQYAIIVYLFMGQFPSKKRTAQARPSCSGSPLMA